MIYLHIIDTIDIDAPVKSMFIEDKSSYKLGKLISTTEMDNLIIINSVERDPDDPLKRYVKILHVFLNGVEDIDYTDSIKIDKKNT